MSLSPSRSDGKTSQMSKIECTVTQAAAKRAANPTSYSESFDGGREKSKRARIEPAPSSKKPSRRAKSANLFVPLEEQGTEPTSFQQATNDESASSLLEPAPFVPCPVTRAAFVEKYKIEGMPGSEVYYQPDWLDPKTATEWRDELERLPEWYRPMLTVYGKKIQQSRHIAAFSTAPGLELKYSGHPVEMHAPFPDLIAKIAAKLSSEDCLGSSVHFNHCMLNRYEDGSIYIGKHSDNVENKVIVTVSLGAPRIWIMEQKKPRKGTKAAAALAASGEHTAVPLRKKWTLENGSLLVMQGDTQRQWTHEIPKEAKVKDSRISITFRQLVYD